MDIPDSIGEFKILKNKYVHHLENPDYEIIRRRNCATDIEQALFEHLLETGVKLQKLYPGVRGMASTVRIKAKPINLKMA